MARRGRKLENTQGTLLNLLPQNYVAFSINFVSVNRNIGTSIRYR